MVINLELHQKFFIKINNKNITVKNLRIIIINDNLFICYHSLKIRSESSSESVIISEFGETNSLMRRRRHEVRQLYDVGMRRNVRKPFLFYDDEPSIY